MFIVIPLHRESLRQIMNQGLLTHSIKIQVLEMLKNNWCHGDIKDFFDFTRFTDSTLIKKTKNKPQNILVDYDIKGGVASNFRSILADWGTAGGYSGGTPLYAGPRTYESDFKDLFSIGRMALELFLDQKGKS